MIDCLREKVSIIKMLRYCSHHFLKSAFLCICSWGQTLMSFERVRVCFFAQLPWSSPLKYWILSSLKKLNVLFPWSLQYCISCFLEVELEEVKCPTSLKSVSYCILDATWEQTTIHFWLSFDQNLWDPQNSLLYTCVWLIKHLVSHFYHLYMCLIN